MNQQPNKILIIGPSWVGDMIMTQSLFITLKNINPGALIDVLAPEWTWPLLERMPEVNQAISMDLKHGELGWKKRKNIGRRLQANQYDQVIVIPNSLKSALIPYFAKIPIRTGWLKEPRYLLLNDLRRLDKSKYPLMVQRLNALAYPDKTTLPDSLPEPALAVEQNSVQQALEKHKLELTKPVLILCPGAEFGPSKRWPENHYSEVANQYLDDNWQVWLFGSANDNTVCQEINDMTKGRCHNLAGETSLAEAIDLMSVASLVLSNDSGLMHMAAALKRPLVAVYGSTSTDFTPPLSANSYIAQKPIECSPCFKRECPLGHNQCMTELMPGDVLTILKDTEMEASK